MKSAATTGMALGILFALLVVATGAWAEDQSFNTISTARENIFSMAPVQDPTQGPEDNKTWAVPAGRSRDDVHAREKQIFFPPDPPPLGAQMNSSGQTAASMLVAPELVVHVGELFYPPLSTCLTEFADTAYRRFRSRVEIYTEARATLLAELRTTLTVHAGAPAEVRLAIITALARRQHDALMKLEAEAEELRNDMADIANWYDRREWKLGRGPLRDRLPQHAVLEYQVVRAAAFYQAGLGPAQRRLLREAAMLLQDELFKDEADTTSGVAAPALIFFSPDLARILPTENYPAAVRTMLEEFAEEKDALRRAVKETVLEIDRFVLTSARTSACETLAREQGPRLAALEERAETIRREYAPTFARHRLASPLELPPDLAGRIEEYEEGKRQFLAGLAEERRALLERLSRSGDGTVRTFIPGRGWFYPAVENLNKTYPQEHADELTRLTRMLGEIYPLLVAAAGPDRVAPMLAGSDTFLVTFMAELRRERAYYEYEIAVWEPGLSPAQRRLLFNGAMAQLELPVPRPERQPTKLPLTLLQSQAE